MYFWISCLFPLLLCWWLRNYLTLQILLTKNKPKKPIGELSSEIPKLGLSLKDQIWRCVYCSRISFHHNFESAACQFAPHFLFCYWWLRNYLTFITATVIDFFIILGAFSLTFIQIWMICEFSYHTNTNSDMAWSKPLTCIWSQIFQLMWIEQQTECDKFQTKHGLILDRKWILPCPLTLILSQHEMKQQKYWQTQIRSKGQ